jgi:maltooligosyltrehalose trehalohydrolase
LITISVITAIELMPVGQFPGSRNWGYDGTYWYAVQNSYGGPRELQRLVDACHASGIAVILDVIYNHSGPEGNYINEFGPYFTVRHRTPWGSALNYDDRGSDDVRDFVLHNVRQWVRDFRMDGLRLDAVHAIIDSSPLHLLADIKSVADEEATKRGWPVQVIAESNMNDVRLLLPHERGGYDLDAQWNDEFHHAVHALLTGERDGYYSDFEAPATELVKAINKTFVFDGCYSPFLGRRHGAPARDMPGDRFIVSIQTHDQVGNRALGDRLTSLLTPAQLRLAAALMLLSPYVPMLFMGEEYGEERRFPFFCDFGDPQLQEAVRLGRRAEFASFGWTGEIPDPQDEQTYQDAKLSWRWLDGTWHAGLRFLYQDLLAARRTWPALQDFRHRSAELISTTDGATLLFLVRGDSTQPTRQIHAYFNLGAAPAPCPVEQFASRILLSTESPRYGGQDASAMVPGHILAPYECVVLKPVDEEDQ